MSLAVVVLLSCLSGVAFSMIAIAYKFGCSVNILPLQSFAFASAAGAALCLAVGWRGAETAPLFLYVTAAAAGFSQYLVVKLVKVILRYGPLSPMWSAMMLSFVPTIGYSSIFLGEEFTLWNALSVLAAVLAVIAASAAGEGAGESGGGRAEAPRAGRFIYGGLLAALLFTNTFLGCSQKQLGRFHDLAGEPLMRNCGALFLGVMYLFLGLPLIGDLTLSGRWNFRPKRWSLLALTATGGTVTGMSLQTLLLPYPATVYFTCSSSASMLFTAIFSTLVFGERRTAGWYATVIFTMLAIALSNAAVFMP